TLVVYSLDGSASQAITVNITGANDNATITGTIAGDVTEDSGDMVESALITVSDVDQGENQLQAASGNTAHGSYAVTTSGWTFTADNSTLQSLGAGDSASDSFTITSDDGTDSKTVVVTFHGVNDPATISGTIAGDVTEDSGDMVESALITVSDVDQGENQLQAASGNTAHGSYAVDRKSVV